MGFLERWKGTEKKPPPVPAALIGTGPEAQRLERAYRAHPGLDLVAVEPAARADEVIRRPGLRAVEIVAAGEERQELAEACLRAGLFTSVDPPPGLEAIERLRSLAAAHRTGLRFRLLPLYYPPYAEVKRLVDEDHLGRPLCLRLVVRLGKGLEVPAAVDPGQWLLERELGFLALSPWLLGSAVKVYSRLHSGAPGSSLLMWRYAGLHQYGYLVLEFCPELHVRTFTEPVHRFLELTALGGVIMVTRGEGQLLRMPALMVRGKSTTTAFEMVPDEWETVYDRLAAETFKRVGQGGPVIGSADLAAAAVRLAQAAVHSREKGDEVAVAGRPSI